MQKSIITYFLLLASFFSISCSNSSVEEPVCTPTRTSGKIMPLKMGNTWIYHIQELDFGKVIEDLYDTVVISHDTIISGEQWFFYLGDILTNRSDGLWGLFRINKDSSAPYLMYPYPTKAGNIIPTPFDSGLVFASDTIISVPLGCFFANVYFLHKTKYYSSSFVPGIGEIKWEQWYNGFEHHDLIKVVELVSAKLN